MSEKIIEHIVDELMQLGEEKFFKTLQLLHIVIEKTGEKNSEIEDLRAKLEAAEAVLEKINNIRNSIVGTQTINWSEHIYPLVAALNEAGLKGMGYPKARKYLGTLIERTVTAEKEYEKLQAHNALLVKALEFIYNTAAKDIGLVKFETIKIYICARDALNRARKGE
ncbi:hypothetical protein [Pelosinus propionicus]|uniref:Uncharacterized protein n=1 Tax=Pelosinus propionicus DSM 13327 TaxID=1123291 RepID=A0A1I4N2M9_9FIRM|nr:hypothetical protein [Pelosinus propionicus]SFM09567.1 hypothetical protein SAMN04490355_104049 [Pelosinus propionicus DSM 13327]